MIKCRQFCYDKRLIDKEGFKETMDAECNRLPANLTNKLQKPRRKMA